MPIKTKPFGGVVKFVLLVCLFMPGTAGATTNVVYSPDEASLRAAINLGGWVGMGFNGIVTLTNTIAITNNVFLDGQNFAATISGGNAVRLFYVAPGASFGVTNLTLANGSCLITNGPPSTPADGGAIYNDGGLVTLVACTLTNNSAQSLIFGGLARGGAIFNNGGSVLLNQSAISNNTVVGGGTNNPTASATTGMGLGGAIFNLNGSVTILSCNVSSNSCVSVSEATGGIWGNGNGLTMGGAAYQTSGSLMVVNTIFSLNQVLSGDSAGVFGPASPCYGGAIVVMGGSLTIDRSQFFANTAHGGNSIGAGSAFGGAIYAAAALKVEDSSFFGNQAFAGQGRPRYGVEGYGGAIYNLGTAKLAGCAVYSNYVQGGSGALSDYAESGHGGSGLGGGIFNAAQLTATNCVMALNSAVGGPGAIGSSDFGSATCGNALGGGVFNNTNATFIAMNLTIASNICTSIPLLSFLPPNGLAVGVQIANTNGTLRLHNSVLAGTNNAYGPITDDGYNLCSDGTANLSSSSSHNNTDPQLAPLADYGGPTLCMALLASSPAIDFGDSTGLPNTDQRGYLRPFGDGPDMGAYEYGSYLLVIPSLNILANTTNILLSFIASPPSVYRLQASTNLSTWTDLNTNGPFASPTNISQTISPQGIGRCFFRLRVQ